MTIEQMLFKINGLEHANEISRLKKQLSASDYKAIKHSEGLISDEEYAPIKEKREQIRKKIRELGG